MVPIMLVIRGQRADGIVGIRTNRRMVLLLKRTIAVVKPNTLI